MTNRILVLDKGYVELITEIPEINRISVDAARTSFLGETKGDEADSRLTNYLVAHDHWQPFEFAQMVFRIKAPMVVWWQLVRYRTFSFNLQSGRYVQFDPDEWYRPAQWRMQSVSNKQGSAGNASSDVTETFNAALDAHVEASFRLYDLAISQGIAKEMARFFLPSWLTYYTGYVRMDARNLVSFIKQRLAPDAQYEIRKYAEAIFEIWKAKMPWMSAAVLDKWRDEDYD